MRIRRKPGRATDLASSETRRKYGLAASGSEPGGGIAISPLTERFGIPSNAASASGTAEGRNPALLGSPPIFTSSRTGWQSPASPARRSISAASSTLSSEWII